MKAEIFSLRDIWGCVSIVLIDLLISVLIFYSLLIERSQTMGPYPFLSVLLLSICILTALIISGIYSFLKDFTPLSLARCILYSLFPAVTYIALVLIFLSETELLKHILLLMIPLYIAIYIFHFFVLYILDINKKRVIFVGANEKTEQIIDGIKKIRFTCYKPIGVITYLPEKVGKKISDIPIIGEIKDLEKLAISSKCDVIVFCLKEWRGKMSFHQLIKLKLLNIRFEDGTLFYEKIIYALPITEFLRPSIFLFQSGFQISLFHSTVKRATGIIMALVILLLSFPIMLIISILIKLDSPGPVFYLQDRVGLNGKVFRLIKFRSMIKDAEKYTGPIFAQKKDPRITRIGKILRRFRLDELPQFINILKGDMNLVGPRPERPEFVKKMREVIPYYDLRHTIRPGITGWAQVKYKYGDSIEDGRKKLEYDLFYIKNRSLFLDIIIVFITIKVMLTGWGSR